MPRLIARFQAHREFELDKQWRAGLLMHTKSGQRGFRLRPKSAERHGRRPYMAVRIG